MKTAKEMTPEEYTELVLPARRGGVLRGLAPGMSRDALLRVEGKKYLDLDGCTVDTSRWQREILAYDDSGAGAHETLTATFAGDVLATAEYTLHIDGVAADKLITAVAKEVVVRLESTYGKPEKDGKRWRFSISAPVTARLSVLQTKVSRGGDPYSELCILLSGE